MNQFSNDDDDNKKRAKHATFSKTVKQKSIAINPPKKRNTLWDKHYYYQQNDGTHLCANSLCLYIYHIQVFFYLYNFLI